MYLVYCIKKTLDIIGGLIYPNPSRCILSLFFIITKILYQNKRVHFLRVSIHIVSTLLTRYFSSNKDGKSQILEVRVPVKYLFFGRLDISSTGLRSIVLSHSPLLSRGRGPLSQGKFVGRVFKMSHKANVEYSF